MVFWHISRANCAEITTVLCTGASNLGRPYPF